MTTILIAAVIVSVVITAAFELARWLGHDGGPRHSPLPRVDDSWSANLPTRPYALR